MSETRLIDANALIKDMESICNRSQFGRSTAKMCVKRAPTIDAVPVVRCGECANARCIDKNEGVYTCTHPQWTRRPYKDTYEESKLFHGLEASDYCSYGAKMDKEDE